MILRGKEEYAKKFLAFKVVEDKWKIDLRQAAGFKVTKRQRASLESAKKLYASEFFKDDGEERHRSWSKKTVEQMIAELAVAGKFQDWEKTALLTTYLVGNQKNHLSPSSIQDYMIKDLFGKSGKREMSMALSFITISIVKMATILIDEVTDRPEVKKNEIRELWNDLINIKPST